MSDVAFPQSDATGIQGGRAGFVGEERPRAIKATGAADSYRRLGLRLALTDGICFSIALGVSYLVRFGFQPLPFEWIVTAIAAPFVWVTAFHAFRLHTPQHLSNWEEFTRTISAASVGIIVVTLLSYWSKSSFSRAWVGLTWLFALLLELLARRIWRWRITQLRLKGELSFRTLIVGTNREAKQLVETLQTAAGAGFTPLGCIATDVDRGDDVRSFGHVSNLRDIAKSSNAECLFVASTAVGAEEMLTVVQTARQLQMEIRISAQLPEMLTQRLTVQQVGDVVTLSLKPVRLTGTQAAMKRAFDLLVSIPAFILLSPVIALVAVAIKATSPGGVFFKQPRVTKDGVVFSMLKFRTMYENADAIMEGSKFRLDEPFFKLQEDPRLTPVGRVIRKWSLDELPQLWNVIKGDMSLVGPRPLPEVQVAANPELLQARLEVSAGVTGWWQVHGRSDTEADEALRMDVFYIENWSLGLDIYILAKTLGAVVARRGAY